MFDDTQIAFLESGCALVVGLVDATGRPYATYGWGLSMAPGSSRVRLLLGAADLDVDDPAVVGRSVAITGTNVESFKSLQLKGTIVGAGVATDDDLVRCERYKDDFFGDVTLVDGVARFLLEQTSPAAIVACDLEVSAVFDQTPGPKAGARLGR